MTRQLFRARVNTNHSFGSIKRVLRQVVKVAHVCDSLYLSQKEDLQEARLSKFAPRGRELVRNAYDGYNSFQPGLITEFHRVLAD